MRQISANVKEATTGVQVYVTAQHLEDGEQCQMPGCTTTHEGAFEDMQRWHFIHGRATWTEGASPLVLHWSSACDEHTGVVIDAVADAMIEHGAPWDVETLTYDYSRSGTPDTTREIAMTGDHNAAAPPLF